MHDIFPPPLQPVQAEADAVGIFRASFKKVIQTHAKYQKTTRHCAVGLPRCRQNDPAQPRFTQ